MKPINSQIKSIFTIYLIWSVILIIYSSLVVLTGELEEKFGSELYRKFLFSFYAVSLFMTAIGALLAWYTQQGKTWAMWLFIIFCLYLSFDAIWSLKIMESKYSGTVELSDWIGRPIKAVIWLSLAVFAWYTYPNNTSMDASVNPQ